MARRSKLLSKAEYAAQIGVHRSQITRYVQAGMPAPGGMIDPVEADAWRAANLDPTKPKSKPSAGSQKPARDQKSVAERPSPAAKETGAGDGIPDLNEARARDTHYSAEMRKRKVLEHDRTHISLAEVEAAWDAANTMYRQGLDGVAGRTASLIASLTGGDAARIEEVIRDEHRNVLAEVAKNFEQSAFLAEGGRALPPSGGDVETAEEAVD